MARPFGNLRNLPLPAALEARLLTFTMAVGVVLAQTAGCGERAPIAVSKSDNNKVQSQGAEIVEGKSALESPAPPTGYDLYLQHCAACHGERGDGQGIAARFLFPKPRDFLAGRFRLVSTNNGMPTRDDLNAVLQRGMPGSSMPSWAHLPQADRELLIDEIIRLRKQGLYEQLVAQLKEDGDEVVEEEVQAIVKNRTTPGALVEPPSIPAADGAMIARGKEIYFKQSCQSCHGIEGRGDGQQQMFDAEGLPTRPRDFTLGIFKGMPDVPSIYRRIAAGMPGSPMPASQQLTPEQIVDLSQYILSLSNEKVRESTVLRRNKIVARRVAALPPDGQSGDWSSAEEIRVGVTPLWWRDDADVDLHVQALHDGRSLAIRLRWRDATPNRHSTRTEMFKDGGAVELYRGPKEPFLGMGDAQHPVDVWFWDADRQTAEEAPEGEYPNMAVDVYPMAEPNAVASAEYHRQGAAPANPMVFSLPALAVGNQIVPQAAKHAGGSSLAAGGPGSATFRPPHSQVVEATGQWNDGQWTVVLRRSLDVKEDGGAKLEPGDTVSAAFAIWDGAKGDRNGQKLVSIWQDFQLESDSP